MKRRLLIAWGGEKQATGAERLEGHWVCVQRGEELLNLLITAPFGQMIVKLSTNTRKTG